MKLTASRTQDDAEQNGPNDASEVQLLLMMMNMMMTMIMLMMMMMMMMMMMLVVTVMMVAVKQMNAVSVVYATDVAKL